MIRRRQLLTGGAALGAYGALAAAANALTPAKGSPPPSDSKKHLLELVPSTSRADAAYGMVRLGQSYTGPPIEMRITEGGVLTTQDIPFHGNAVSAAAGDAFAAMADAGKPVELRFYDQTGNGNHSTFVSTAVPGLSWSTAKINKLRVANSDLLLNNVGLSQQGLQIPVGVALNQDAYSSVFLGSVVSATPLQAVILFESTSQRHDLYYQYQVAGGGFSYYDGNVHPSTVITECSRSIQQAIVGGTNVDFYVNDNSYSFSKTKAGNVTAGGYISYSLGATYGGGQDCLAFVLYDRILTSTEISVATNWGYSAIGFPASSQDRLIGIGDSTMQGLYCGNNQTYIAQGLPGLVAPLRAFINARSGEEASELLAAVSRSTALVRDGATNIAIIQCGFNDMLNGVAPATAAASVFGICDAMRSAGAKVVIVPSQHVAALGQEAQDSFVGILAANWTSHADAFSVNWADPIIGSSGNPADPVYYYIDQIHLTAAGHKIMKRYAFAAINSLL